MKITDFIARYCSMYDITEDDFTSLDVEYIEDCFYDYATNKTIPDFMRLN